MRLLILLPLLLAFPQDPDAKKAKDLLDRVAAKIRDAKSVRYAFEIAAGPMKLEGELRVLGADRASMVLKDGTRKRSLAIRCDGRKIKSEGDDAPRLPAGLTAAAFAECCRAGIRESFIVTMSDLEGGADRKVEVGVPAWGGTEKVGEIEAALLVIPLKMRGEEGSELKLWVDPAKAVPLKKEISMGPVAFQESITALEFDLPWKAEEFEFHSEATVAEGRRRQLTRAVELFQLYTGRPPASTKELVERPAWLEKDVFWPEGGFWSGPPSTLAYEAAGRQAKVDGQLLAPATGRAIVAPTPRLAAQFTAKVRLAILAGAVEGYVAAYGSAPDKADELWTRPAWAKAWPENGFLPELPKDPWGRPLVLKGATAMVEGAKEKSLRTRALTPDEVKALEAGGAPRGLAEVEKTVRELLPALKDDSVTVREDAVEKILALGLAGVDVLESLAKDDPDAGLRTQVESLRSKHPVPSPAWRRELGSLVRAAQVSSGGGSPLQRSNERNASATLKTFATAQADFRSNDRDDNKINDFWVKDVAGLCGLGGDAKNAIKLIEPAAARADASPARGAYDLFKDLGEPEPKAGYLFAVLLEFESAPGTFSKYDAGEGRNPERFGFVAYPAEPGVSGDRMFILNEDYTLLWKNSDGEPPTAWPLDPAAEGWKKLD